MASNLSNIKVTRTDGVWSSFNFDKEKEEDTFYLSIDEELENIEIIINKVDTATTLDVTLTTVGIGEDEDGNRTEDTQENTIAADTNNSNRFEIASLLTGLEDKNIVVIIATDSNGVENTYTINIVRYCIFDIIRSFFEVHLGKEEIKKITGEEWVVVYDNIVVSKKDIRWARVSAFGGGSDSYYSSIPARAVSCGSIVIRRYYNMCTMQLFFPLNQGTQGVHEFYCRIIDHILEKAYDNETRVTHLLVRTPYQTIIGEVDNVWYQVNISIPFQFDYHHKLRGT